MTGLRRNPRFDLRQLTPARVGLATSGHSLATAEVLQFQLAHAQARDAVRMGLDVGALVRRLEELDLQVIALKSRAPDRQTYLKRPELGRRLAEESAGLLRPGAGGLSIVIADGLSAQAVERNVVPLLRALLPLLVAEDWPLTPVAVVEQGRVAVGDEVGLLLGGGCTLMLIGERPGLSVPASLGAYLTWRPALTRTDAERNCISNIHPEGLGPADAAAKIMGLLQGARALGRTGVELKEGQISLAADPLITSTLSS